MNSDITSLCKISMLTIPLFPPAPPHPLGLILPEVSEPWMVAFDTHDPIQTAELSKSFTL